MKEGRKCSAICRTGNEVLVFVGEKLIIERCLLCVCVCVCVCLCVCVCVCVFVCV